MNKNQNKKDKNGTGERSHKKLSEWRQLEKQMIKGDGQKSPPKQSHFNSRIFEEIKGDSAMPESGDLQIDLSYEDVQIELFEDDNSPGSAKNSRDGSAL